MNGLNGCYRCPDRTVGCHSKCEQYKSWLEAERKRKDTEKKARAKEDEIVQYVRKSARRQMRRMGMK